MERVARHIVLYGRGMQSSVSWLSQNCQFINLAPLFPLLPATYEKQTSDSAAGRASLDLEVANSFVVFSRWKQTT